MSLHASLQRGHHLSGSVSASQISRQSWSRHMYHVHRIGGIKTSGLAPLMKRHGPVGLRAFLFIPQHHELPQKDCNQPWSRRDLDLRKTYVEEHQ